MSNKPLSPISRALLANWSATLAEMAPHAPTADDAKVVEITKGAIDRMLAADIRQRQEHAEAN